MGRGRSCGYHEASQASPPAQDRKAVLLLPPHPFLLLALCVGRHVSRRTWPVSGQLLHSSVERKDQTWRRDGQERAIPQTLAGSAVGVSLRCISATFAGSSFQENPTCKC